MELQHPIHNGVQVFWSFTIFKISIQLISMLEDKNMLNLESSIRNLSRRSITIELL